MPNPDTTASSSGGGGGGGGTSSANNTSRHPKLDGVLYHFYSKTSAVITSCRLTHFEGVDTVMAGSRSSTSSRQQTAVRRTSTDSPSNTSIHTTGRASATNSTGRRPSKWFALEIDDQDVFRDEIRLWRNISALVPDWLLDSPPSVLPYQGPAYVPPMILDVILDTSALSKKHVLMIDEIEPDGRTRRRVRVDGQDTDPTSSRRPSTSSSDRMRSTPAEDEPLDMHRQSIVLETWRLDFAIHNPPDPPDLPSLYKQATAHFRDLHGFVMELPSYPLHQRLKQAWDSNLERQKLRTAELGGIGSGDDKTYAEDNDDVDDGGASLLKVGLRLAIGRSSDSDDGEIGLRVPVGSMKHTANNSAGVTRSHSFPTLLTPIGSMGFSVEYRCNCDFFVEDWHVIKSLQEIALDEDYFKPTIARHLQRQASAQQSSVSSSPASQQPSGISGESQPRSLLSATSHQRQQISAGTNPDATVNTVSSPASLQETSSSRSASTATGQVGSFGTASGRPVAGLSSLRASPSVAGYSASPSTAALACLSTSSGTSSPALTAALTSDAAFLTHARRSSSSASERRLRTLNMLSSTTDKDGPPSPVMTTHVGGRPILSRATVSAVSGVPRSGSYSPSSPSPLAQQLHAQQNAALLADTASQSGRLSSSPSYRGTAFAHSISPSLRSVFQTYTPSHSQASVSSLSQTPPKFLLEGQQGSSGSGPAASFSLRSRASNELVSGGSGSGSGYPFQASRQPTVAPQMIKRYSSTFNYRQGRQGSYLGSEGSSGGGGAGTGDAGLYSKSWQARIEQRQMLGARSLGREDGLHFPASSPLSRRQHMLAESMDQEDDLDDFVRMIDSRPSLGGLADATDDSSTHFIGSDRTGTAATSRGSRSRQDETTLSGVISSNRASPTHGSSTLGFQRNYGLNRQQVDDMLSKMQHSVREFSSSLATSRSSPASGGAATSSSGAHSHTGGSEPSAAYQPSSTTTANPVAPSTSFTRSPLSRGGFSASSAIGPSAVRTGEQPRSTKMKAIASGDGRASEAPSLEASPQEDRSPLKSSPPLPGVTMNRLLHVTKQRSPSIRPTTYGDSDRANAAFISTDRQRSSEVDDKEAASPDVHDNHDEDQTSRSYPGRHTSRGSLELYGGTPRSYDPLDDEAAGRLELAGEEPTTAASGMSGCAQSALGRPVQQHQQQQHHHLHHHHHPHPHTLHQHRQHSSVATSPAADEEAVRQRQADYELARNFTQTVSMRGGNGRAATSATVGRTSLSPWRQRGFHLASTGATTANYSGSTVNSTTPAHSPSSAVTSEGLSAAHYFHQQLAARHASASTSGAHQHSSGGGGGNGGSAGTRSGPGSVGPASRSGSPSVD